MVMVTKIFATPSLCNHVWIKPVTIAAMLVKITIEVMIGLLINEMPTESVLIDKSIISWGVENGIPQRVFDIESIVFPKYSYPYVGIFFHSLMKN